MTNTSALNPLQSLLLFQALAVHPSDAKTFANASATLRNSPLFLGDAKPDDPRFSAQSLRSLYDQKIKEASRSHRNREPSPKKGARSGKGPSAADRETPNGGVASDLVPELYASYKSHVIQEIKEEEQKYNALLAEVRALRESGSVTNGQKVHPDNDARSSSNVVASEKKGRDTAHAPSIPRNENGAISTPAHPQGDSPDGSQKIRHGGHTSIDSIINHDEPSEEAVSTPGAGLRSSQGSGPSASQQSAISNRQGGHEWRQAPSPTSTAQNAYKSSQPSSTPVILPPPPGMARQSYSQNGAWNTAQDTKSMNRTSSIPTSPHTRVAPNQPHERYSPQLGGSDHPVPSGQLTSPQYRDPWNQSANNNAPPGPHAPNVPYPQHQQSPYPGNYPPQQGGVMLPPFQVAPQAPRSSNTGSLPQRANAKHVPEPLQLRHPAGGAEVSPVGTPVSASQQTPIAGARTSQLRRTSILVSPGSSTAWKPSPVQVLERPRPRSVSPISDHEANDTASRPRRPGRPPRGQNANEPTPQPSTARKGRKPMMGRLGSPALSSSARSLSIASQAGPSTSRRVKDEPEPTTPAVTESASEVDPFSAPSTARPLKRGMSTKRKRADSGSVTDNASFEDASMAIAPGSPVPPPTTIVASRNFLKSSKGILETIESHKHGSLFKAPVRARDAEGYADIVKRPQDLKSIRAAISAGSRAVATALAEDAPQTSPGSAAGGASGSTVVLPISEALMPPKGIVNAGQLEQEIMRMFANAVMFNPGDEGVVEDTREMFEDVQTAIQQWREAEGTIDEEGGAAGTGNEDDAGSVVGSKRRRL